MTTGADRSRSPRRDRYGRRPAIARDRGFADAFLYRRRHRAGGRRGLLHGARRRDAGRRRRVRLRQERHGAVDPAARGRPAGPHRRRRDPLRRRQSAGAERRRDGGHSRQRDLDDLPGADDLAEPADDDRPPDQRSRRAAPGRVAPRGDGPGDRGAAPRPHPGAGAPRARLPAPAFGRHAAARDDRDGAVVQPEAADRRRADHRARRDDPGADPRSDARIAGDDRAPRSS